MVRRWIAPTLAWGVGVGLCIACPAIPIIVGAVFAVAVLLAVSYHNNGGF